MSTQLFQNRTYPGRLKRRRIKLINKQTDLYNLPSYINFIIGIRILPFCLLTAYSKLIMCSATKETLTNSKNKFFSIFIYLFI